MAGEFGEIYHVKCGWRRRSGIPGKGVWFTNKQLSGGRALIDLGVHFLDLSMFFMDYPKVSSVSGAAYSKFGASESRLRPGYKNNGDGKYDVEDIAVGIVRMKNGATIDFEFSWASKLKKSPNILKCWEQKAELVLRMDNWKFILKYSILT